MRNRWQSLSFLFLGLLLSSCGSSDVTVNLSAEERFELGKKKFEQGDYLEAIADFDIIRLQYPGSGVADDAQYYLGECRFKREEFLLAAEEYQAVKRNMPSSPFVPLAQYKTALSYYSLSPKSALDQKYIDKAIDEFQVFLEYYPTHELAADAAAKIKELDTRLAKRLYDTGVLYMTMGYYKAAGIYFNSVIEKYHDTEFAEPALFSKAQTLTIRKHYDEAKKDIERFFEKYPNSSLKKDAESLRADIDDHLKGKSAAIGLDHVPDRA